jgi:transcriptional regulator with XRE-family HTH domain
MKLGDNIQFFRKKEKLSQEELAEKCNVSRQAVTKWEAGESIPSIEKLITLTEIYDVSLDELVGIAENNSYSKLMKLVKEFAVEDIPENEDDEISAIVTRYLIFAKSINLDATSTLNGLQDIFLKKGKEGQ